MTNSFGVPSKGSVFLASRRKAFTFLCWRRSSSCLELYGTVKKDQTEREFVSDFAHTARMSYETGAKVLEVNLSCPNVETRGLYAIT
ncbi:hypothetical protein IPH70_03360 [Candidatus Roizmanbacteria bacterium]|nr:MAG: hypothetical protein IPH70_03360 [Candidatus Roizmanbacteria bacterium]